MLTSWIGSIIKNIYIQDITHLRKILMFWCVTLIPRSGFPEASRGNQNYYYIKFLNNQIFKSSQQLRFDLLDYAYIRLELDLIWLTWILDLKIWLVGNTGEDVRPPILCLIKRLITRFSTNSSSWLRSRCRRILQISPAYISRESKDLARLTHKQLLVPC